MRISYANDCHVDVVPAVTLDDGRQVIICYRDNTFEDTLIDSHRSHHQLHRQDQPTWGFRRLSHGGGTALSHDDASFPGIRPGRQVGNGSAAGVNFN